MVHAFVVGHTMSVAVKSNFQFLISM